MSSSCCRTCEDEGKGDDDNKVVMQGQQSSLLSCQMLKDEGEGVVFKSLV